MSNVDVASVAPCYYHRDLAVEPREAMRGGQGKGHARTYLNPGQLTGVQAVTEMTLEPGTSIGLHPHPDNEELYVFVRGHGEALWNEQRFPVGPGDATLCRRGEQHGLINTGSEPLVFLAVLTAAVAK